MQLLIKAAVASARMKREMTMNIITVLSSAVISSHLLLHHVLRVDPGLYFQVRTGEDVFILW